MFLIIYNLLHNLVYGFLETNVGFLAYILTYLNAVINAHLRLSDYKCRHVVIG